MKDALAPSGVTTLKLAPELVLDAAQVVTHSPLLG
jgi:hypothetical protein